MLRYLSDVNYVLIIKKKRSIINNVELSYIDINTTESFYENERFLEVPKLNIGVINNNELLEHVKNRTSLYIDTWLWNFQIFLWYFMVTKLFKTAKKTLNSWLSPLVWINVVYGAKMLSSHNNLCAKCHVLKFVTVWGTALQSIPSTDT